MIQALEVHATNPVEIQNKLRATGEANHNLYI